MMSSVCFPGDKPYDRDGPHLVLLFHSSRLGTQYGSVSAPDLAID